MDSSYQIIHPTVPQVPILVSVPHCGTAIPKHLINRFDQTQIQSISDTDFFVDRLYEFASGLGITIIKAHFSRWVIDLNRSPKNENLYKDGRIITALTPTKDFNGSPIYKTENDQPNIKEVEDRLEKYYQPYHNKIAQILSNFKSHHGIALLWDAHSIKRFVPTIHHLPFPDLVLGSNDCTSASAEIIDQTVGMLSNSHYTHSHNHPFKGGHITRTFGNPENNVHALQLEMSKDCYMDDAEIKYHPTKVEKVQVLLRQIFQRLINQF